MTVDQMIDDIIRREGGYVDHPADRGGPTKYGITLRTLSVWRGRGVDCAEVRDLDSATAREIYRHTYYQAPKIDQLPPGFQPFLFDCAVNHGPSRAVKFLQRVLRNLNPPISIDGKIGPKTCEAVRHVLAVCGSRPVLKQLIDQRRQFYHQIVHNDPSQKVFLKGWLNRLAEFERMENDPVSEPKARHAATERDARMWAERAERAEARVAELDAALAKLARHLPDDARAIIVDMATEETVGHLVGRQWNE